MLDERTSLPDNAEAYCPICQKIVCDDEIMPVVCACYEDENGDIFSVVNRAFHFPNCKGAGELDIREVSK